MVSVLLANARSIVFTLTMDEMSHGVGFHRHHTDTNSSVTSILSSSFDSLKPLPKVVQCMAVLMGETCSNLSPFVHRNMAAAWEGTCIYIPSNLYVCLYLMFAYRYMFFCAAPGQRGAAMCPGKRRD